jgi:hypothetical protein
MNYQMHLDLHHWSEQRREEALGEVRTMRLEKRLRENRGGQASRLTALSRRRHRCVGRGLQGSPSPCAGR